MTRITAIGECMVEMAPTDSPGTYRMGFAGDTMNTAWYLRRLLGSAHAVDYLTAVGTDAVSDDMVAFLSDAGLGIDHVLRRDGRTVGLYLIRLTDGERSFGYWRGQSAARTLAADGATLTRALSGADMAYLSGITLAILPDLDRQTLLDTLATFRADGGRIVFDPNLRPALWDTPDAMRAAVMQAAALSHTVLPSHEDEATWFGDAGPTATADRYAAAGAACVVVKNGPGEIVTRANGETTRHPPVTADRVLDTTAAGDSFNAGYLAARIDGADLPEAVARAATLAASVIGQRGALVDPGA